MKRFVLGLWIVLAGCEPEGSDVGTDPADELPDIAGGYALVFSDLEGCEEHPEGSVAAFEGDLVIEGDAEALLFTLADGTTLDGSIDAAFTWEASGTATRDGATQDLFLEGLAFIGDETWNLDGEIVADLVDSTGQSTACTLTGLLEATQTP